jgi:hypothetical protein
MVLDPGSEPQAYVMVAVTTTHPKSLKNKWLFLEAEKHPIATPGEKQRRRKQPARILLEICPKLRSKRRKSDDMTQLRSSFCTQ